MNTIVRFSKLARACLALIIAVSLAAGVVQGQAHAVRPYVQAPDDPNPPGEVVRLIFIHHSTGENWLRDDYGGLGRALAENNYFVSDTNYGWGPDAIGDRTDIPNWPEWFRGPESPRYMEALFQENGQNSEYSRPLADPGGENQVILFKSCFPNSELEGNPDDPPAPGDGLTVSNAKYIYNDLLNYFATRPDKLFVAITAPPVQNRANAANARAFNLWLMQDWLASYPYPNVAVFDFYNVLTHRDNHHRFLNGQIEYITSNGRNTSAYASSGDDDHPNAAGSRKATDEFVPLLNIFYHRWRAGAGAVPPAVATQPALPTEAPASPGGAPPGGAPAPQGDLIDDFESGPPAGSEGWIPYWDEATPSVVTCAAEGGVAHSGNQALHLNYNVAPSSWATCALMYGEQRNWQAAQGLSFYLHASQPGLAFNLDAYGGTADNRESYLTSLETTQEMVDGWAYIEIPWSQLLRASWEENPGTPFNPSRAAGIALGFDTAEGGVNGELWIDDMHLLMAEAAPPAPTEAPAAAVAATAAPGLEPTALPSGPTEAASAEEPEKGGGLPCPGALVVGLLVVFVFARRR
jgi:hypothetical protein